MSTGAVWVDLPTLAEIAAIVGVVGGAVITYFFSRRANASVTAEAHRVSGGAVVLEVRPSVTALGPFGLKFKKSDPPTITVIEILRCTGDTANGRFLPSREAFPSDVGGEEQFVNAGETLTSTALFPAEPPNANLIGWCVVLSVASRGIVRHGLHWGDRVFVPVPDYPRASTRREPSGEDEHTSQGDNDGQSGPDDKGSGQKQSRPDAGAA